MSVGFTSIVVQSAVITMSFRIYLLVFSADYFDICSRFHLLRFTEKNERDVSRLNVQNVCTTSLLLSKRGFMTLPQQRNTKETQQSEKRFKTQKMQTNRRSHLSDQRNGVLWTHSLYMQTKQRKTSTVPSPSFSVYGESLHSPIYEYTVSPCLHSKMDMAVTRGFICIPPTAKSLGLPIITSLLTTKYNIRVIALAIDIIQNQNECNNDQHELCNIAQQFSHHFKIGLTFLYQS